MRIKRRVSAGGLFSFGVCGEWYHTVGVKTADCCALCDVSQEVL
jgi:hypothetical protein